MRAEELQNILDVHKKIGMNGRRGLPMAVTYEYFSKCQMKILIKF